MFLNLEATEFLDRQVCLGPVVVISEFLAVPSSPPLQDAHCVCAAVLAAVWFSEALLLFLLWVA